MPRSRWPSAVNDAIDSARATAADAAETIAAKAKDAADTVSAQAKDAADAAAAQAKEALANAKSAADDGVSYVQARYRENPVLVIGVAVAALVAVGVVVRSIFRR